MNLVFANPSLENRFRQLVHAANDELGGWFVVCWTPKTWPIPFSWKNAKRTFRLLGEAPWYIESFLLAPNTDKAPERRWNCWDMPKASELAEATAHALGGTAIHWHTHPTNNGEPSLADWAFAGARCRTMSDRAEFVVVTPRPLRLHSYRVNYGLAATPGEDGVECFRYWSWREGIMRQFRPTLPAPREEVSGEPLV